MEEAVTPSDLKRLDAQLDALYLSHVKSHYQAFATTAAQKQLSHLARWDKNGMLVLISPLTAYYTPPCPKMQWRKRRTPPASETHSGEELYR